MVRRWSYLNQINHTFASEHGSLAFAHHFVVFKATTSYRKPIQRTTKLARRAWSRRKHSHNWLVYQNLLANWSQDYLFFRKYSRFTVALHLFKNSYLTYNLLVFKRTTMSTFLGSEDVIVSNLIRRVIRYSSRLNPLNYTFFKTYRNNSWLYLTTPNVIEGVQIPSELSTDPIFLVHQSSCYITNIDIVETIWPQVLINSLFINASFKIVEVYKILILLTLVPTFR